MTEMCVGLALAADAEKVGDGVGGEEEGDGVDGAVHDGRRRRRGGGRRSRRRGRRAKELRRCAWRAPHSQRRRSMESQERRRARRLTEIFVMSTADAEEEGEGVDGDEGRWG